ncbi:MAG: ABC transporter ATP-binding protein [Candidatus Zixiibacteriota bacterium]|nr:MAG: ABC transporter ATP-binding protein [candidate division Zixibacteria bacterium]
MVRKFDVSTSWLQTKELCRYYRRGPHEVRAVDRVNLYLERGEFLGIVGASGSGKSTMLNLMAGLDTPTSGRIEIDGTALSSLTRRELAAYRARRVGMVFQSFNLLAHQTALKNVELALYFNDTPARARRIRATEILERLGLGDRLDHVPADLSGGEQQRVAIARALVKGPEVLFADEPTGNLDQVNTEQIAELLAGLNRQGLTVVVATHDLDMARRYAHRTVRMDYGKLVATDSGRTDGEPGQ